MPSVGSIIDDEYESDPMLGYLDAISGGGHVPRQAPLTSFAAGAQGANDLLQAIMRTYIYNKYQTRKTTYSADKQRAIASLPEGAGAAELVRAYAATGNPDLAADTASILEKSILDQKAAATYSTTPYFTDSGAIQLSSSGGFKPIEGVTFSPSPAQKHTAEQQARRVEAAHKVRQAEGAANRAARLRAAELQSGGLMALGKAMGGDGANRAYLEGASKSAGTREMVNFYNVIQPQAELAVTALDGVAKIKDAIAQGAYQGPGASHLLQIARGIKVFMGAKKFDRASVTEALEQALDMAGLSQIKSLVGSTAISDADRAAVMKAFGSIDTDPTALSKVLERTEAVARRAIDKNNKAIDKFQRMGIPQEEYRLDPLPYTPMGPPTPTAAHDDPNRELTPEEMLEYERLMKSGGG